MNLNQLCSQLKQSIVYLDVKVTVPNETDGKGKILSYKTIKKPFLSLTAEEARTNRAKVTEQLANGYCDADEIGDEDGRDQFWSAILVWEWSWTWKWKLDSASLHPTDDDLFSWLNDAITDAFNYRSWRPIRHDGYAEKDWVAAGNVFKPFWIDNPQFVHEENAADKSINYFLGTKRGKMYQEANKQKRSANVNLYSIDSMVDENGDCALDYTGAVENESYSNGAKDIILQFLKTGHNIEGLVIDGIINHDTFKETKSSHLETSIDEETGEEVTEKLIDYQSDFDPRKLVKHINSIDDSFMEYFCNEYDLEKSKGIEILEQVHKLNNGKIYNYIKKTLIQIKQSPELLGLLLTQK